MSERQSDPEQRSGIMSSTVSPAQSQAVKGTGINQVLVRCRLKAMLCKHLRKVQGALQPKSWHEEFDGRRQG